MDKILVFGDSITYGKWDTDGGWVTRLRKYVDEKYNGGVGGNVLVYNMGIPGEVAVRMVKRIDQELEFRITNKDDRVLVIFVIGVNDSCPNNWMTNSQTPKKTFKSALKAMIKMAKGRGCETVVLGLAPVNTNKPTMGLKFTNEEVLNYDNYISDVCKELNTKKVDIYDQLLKQSYTNLLVDVVHPNSRGHEMIFEIVKDKLGI